MLLDALVLILMAVCLGIMGWYIISGRRVVTKLLPLAFFGMVASSLIILLQQFFIIIKILNFDATQDL